MKEEDRLRREHVLNIILIGSIIMLALLDAIVFAYSLREGSDYQGVPFTTFSLLPVFFIFLYVLFRRGLGTFVSYLLVITFLASNSYAAYRWGVTLHVVILMYAFIVIVATILRGTKFGFFVTGLIAAFIIPLWYAQFHQLLPREATHLRVADAVIFSILYCLIMIVAWLYDREVERSLLRARTSEQALQEERDLLEIKVQERTEELRSTQLERLRQLNRFAELGQLSSGLFHDVFNLLTAISLREEETAEPAVAHAFTTTKQLQNFMEAVRKQIDCRDTPEKFSLEQGIRHVIQLLDYKAKKERVRVSFIRENSNDISYWGIPFKFQELLINLLLNAIEALEELPKDDHRDRHVIITLKERDNSVHISVQDNGIGMSPETVSRIFEPFFTTKKKGKGIGIGLATIKKIAEEDFRGIIKVESAPNDGSTFTVEFPLIYHEQN